MIESETGPVPPPRALALWLSLLLPLLALRFLGQDSNWDLMNYHLYDPHAWWHGRMATDIAPAQMQTWHNPMLDLPLYWMASAGWNGLLIGLWLTVPMMLALYLLLRLYPRIQAGAPAPIGSLALALMAVTGAGAFTALGTSFNDAFVAAGALGSLYLLVRESADAEKSRAWFWAGAIAGATTGLKLTAAIYCLGLAGAALATPSWRHTPRRLLQLLAGGMLGFALTYAYWGSLLYRLHGNPVFPYYNQIFQSPDAAAVAFADARYRPPSLRDAVLVPLRLLAYGHRYSELPMRDPRLLIGMLGYALLLVRRFLARSEQTLAGLAARRRTVAAFFFVSLAVWGLQYGIYRYVLPLELLACLSLAVALDCLPVSTHWRSGVALLVAVLLVYATVPPKWHRTEFSDPMLSVRMPTLPPQSMVVISGMAPVAYAVIALPDQVPVISIANNFMRPNRCTGLQARAEKRIAGHAGPLWLLRGNKPVDIERGEIAERAYGLSSAATCFPVATTFGALSLCPLQRRPTPAICAARGSAAGR